MLKIQLTALLVLTAFSFSEAGSLTEKLTDLSVKHAFTFSEVSTDTFFIEKYVLYFTQPLDQDDPGAGSFEQRVFLAHRGYDAAVVFVTEGYGADYAGHPRYINELSGLLAANQVCVEHRYFGESVPEEMNWKYLTVANAAGDHHRIVETLKNIYPRNWVSTGISKGGQTAMYHRFHYPTDVTATVGYVCPLNFSVEDKRVYRFLEKVGDEETRNKVTDFQKEILKNKADYLPVFERYANGKNLTYSMGLEKGFELTVLEYSFAFWQWGTTSAEAIPLSEPDKEKVIAHLDKVVDLKWISTQGVRENHPFFYQAMTEIGFYGYDVSAFAEWLSYASNPTFEFSMPENTVAEYSPGPMQKVDMFIRHEASNMIFLYGENDPWSATAVDLTYNSNLLKIVKPGGSHLTRIGNLPEDQKKQVMDTLKMWLNSSE